MYDYSRAPIHGEVVLDGIRYPFSAYPELVDDNNEELDFTGNAHIVALTPQGTISFLLYNDGDIEGGKHTSMFISLPKEYQEAIIKVVSKLNSY